MQPTLRSVALAAALIVALSSSAAPALASENFRATLKLNFSDVNVEFPEGQPPILHITFEGEGHASGLGRVSVVTEVAEVAVDGCRPSVVVHTLTAAAGTVEITSNDEVCPHPSGMLAGSKISGAWTVTGGTGAFAGMTGSGTSGGVLAGEGNVVAMIVGSTGP